MLPTVAGMVALWMNTIPTQPASSEGESFILSSFFVMPLYSGCLQACQHYKFVMLQCLVFIEFFGPKKFNVFKVLAFLIF
jgi:hypothetical protein